MQLWSRLYNAVWLAFFSCVFIPRWMGKYGAPVHVLLGIGMFALTFANSRRLAALPVPPRLQRISRSTANIALFQIVCGVAFGGVKHMLPDVPFVGPALNAIHIVCALAILSQCSSVATGYDMWEEKENTAAPAAPGTAATPEPNRGDATA
jgi:hypothetical protein